MALWLSDRLWVAVLLLSIVSAAIGASLAISLSGGADQPPAAEVRAIAPAARPVERPAAAAELQEAQQTPPESEATQSATVRQPASDLQQSASPAEPQPAAQTSARDADAQPQTAQIAGDEQASSATVSIVPDTIRQGEAFALIVSGADAASAAATVGGGARSWNLSPVGQADAGGWWGVAAVPRDGATGLSDVAVDLYAPDGVWLSTLSAPLLVLANPAPFEEITLGGNGIAVDAAAVQRDHDVRFVEHIAVSGPPRWDGPWLLPVDGEVSGVFGSYRAYDGVPSDGWHHGHDIAADHGDPIVAPAPGAVVWVGDLAIHGSGVIIDHGAGVYSGYWHMSLIAVSAGAEVAAGDWLGNIGTTGLSTGPHLHWEVIVRGVDVDPIQWTQAQRPPLPVAGAIRAEDAAGAADTLD